MEKKSNKTIILSIIIVMVIVVAAAVLLIVNHKSTNLSSAQTATAKQQIQTNWEKFFAASTSTPNRESLLQNGTKFDSQIKSEFSALGAASSTAVIKSINLNNSTSANVIYTVNLNNQPVLTNQNGKAIFINNTWVVSDSTLCELLAMAGNKPAVCANM